MTSSSTKLTTEVHMPTALAPTHYTMTSNTIDTSSVTTSDWVWRLWNVDYTSASQIRVVSADRVWRSWVTSASTNTSVTVDYETTSAENANVWYRWNRGYAPSSAPVFNFGRPEETAEQRAERERRVREQEAERAAAKVRANSLLLSLLNEDQKRDWVEKGHFYLHVGDRKYRIKRGRSGNVELVDSNNEPLERYCAHPIPNVPDEDTAVAQMMHLMYDEDRFIGLANVHYTKPGFRSQKLRLAA
jgi:hypothetical protein